MIEAGNIDFISGLIVGIVTGMAIMIGWKGFRANPAEIVPKK